MFFTLIVLVGASDSRLFGGGSAWSYNHHQFRCSSPKPFETASGWGNDHNTKTLCLPGNSDFGGHVEPCCYHEGWDPDGF